MAVSLSLDRTWPISFEPATLPMQSLYSPFVHQSSLIYDPNRRVIFAITRKNTPLALSSLSRGPRKTSPCSATTLTINPTLSTITTTGSTLSPGLSSVYSLSMVLEDPPAPAARVLAGRALAALSFMSAAALRRIAVAGPPGGFGEDGRAVLLPVLPAPLPGAAAGGLPSGEEARGADYGEEVVSFERESVRSGCRRLRLRRAVGGERAGRTYHCAVCEEELRFGTADWEVEVLGAAAAWSAVGGDAPDGLRERFRIVDGRPGCVSWRRRRASARLP